MSRPRRLAWSFLCVRKCSVSSVIRAVKRAICTSGEPVSAASRRYSSMICVLRSLVIDIAILDTSDASHSCLICPNFTNICVASECISPEPEGKFDFRFCLGGSAAVVPQPPPPHFFIGWTTTWRALPMTWIDTVLPAQADAELKNCYEAVYALYPAEYSSEVFAVRRADGSADSIVA